MPASHSSENGPQQPLTEDELQSLYTWVDSIPLSRPKRNISRDFADGVLMAEVLKHYFPRLVQLHNYSAASSTQQKMYNWNTLQQKVFKKIGFPVRKDEMRNVVKARPGAIEHLLKTFQMKLSKMRSGYDEGASVGSHSPSVRGGSNRSRSVPRYRDEDDSSSFHSKPSTKKRSTKKTQQRRQHDISESSSHHHHEPQMSEHPPYNGAPSSADDPNNIRIKELQETVQILEAKVQKLNLLLRLKDSKIHALTEKLRGANGDAHRK